MAATDPENRPVIYFTPPPKASNPMCDPPTRTQEIRVEEISNWMAFKAIYRWRLGHWKSGAASRAKETAKEVAYWMNIPEHIALVMVKDSLNYPPESSLFCRLPPLGPVPDHDENDSFSHDWGGPYFQAVGSRRKKRGPRRDP